MRTPRKVPFFVPLRSMEGRLDGNLFAATGRGNCMLIVSRGSISCPKWHTKRLAKSWIFQVCLNMVVRVLMFFLLSFLIFLGSLSSGPS